jgi:hypothetical protein
MITLDINRFNNLLNSFENLIFSDMVKEKFNKSPKRFLGHLVGNIHRDFKAVNLLLKNDCLVQAQKLIRHDFEAVVLLTYLDKCDKEYSQDDYIADSEICELKNDFIVYKQTINETKTYTHLNGETIRYYESVDGEYQEVPQRKLFKGIFNDKLKSLRKYTESKFKEHIKKANKKSLLELPELSDETFDDYYKFFVGFKPQFMKIGGKEGMLEKIKNETITCSSGQDLTLKELLWDGYNFYSQIAHNKLPLVNKSTEAQKAEWNVLYMFLSSIIITIGNILIDNKFIPDNSEEFQALKVVLENPPKHTF